MGEKSTPTALKCLGGNNGLKATINPNKSNYYTSKTLRDDLLNVDLTDTALGYIQTVTIKIKTKTLKIAPPKVNK